jgi:hypothetical protein
VFIELLNMRFRKKQAPVQLHGRFDEPGVDGDDPASGPAQPASAPPA